MTSSESIGEQLEHRVELVGRSGFGDPVIDALRVGDQRGARIVALGQGVPFRLGSAEQAQLELEPVGVDRFLADDLGQPACPLPAEQVHLEEAEPRVDVAHRQEQVVVGLGGDVGGTVLLKEDARLLLQPVEAEHSVGDLRVGGHGPGAGGGIECRT